MTTTTVLSSDFWNLFIENINELCDKYNLINNKNCYEMYNLSNDNYVIEIDEYSHPQYEEIELHIMIIDKNNNHDVKYKNTYLFLDADGGRTKLNLPKPLNEFIDEIFHNLHLCIND